MICPKCDYPNAEEARFCNQWEQPIMRFPLILCIFLLIPVWGCDSSQSNQRTTSTSPSQAQPAPSPVAPAQPAQKTDEKLTDLNWEMSEGNATLYNFITGLGGQSRRAIENNLVGAANRGLKYEEIVSSPGQYYSAPAMFGGLVGAIHKINFDKGRAYILGIFTLDGNNHLVAVVCPFKPHVANGDTGMVIGYVADSNIKVNGETLPLVIARVVLTEKEGRQYAAKLASDYMLGK
jgi:hypothetical protein